MSTDQIITDLSRKVSDDVSDRIRQSAQWLNSPSQQMCIALAATAVALGWTVGFHGGAMRQGGVEAPPEEMVDAVWSILRPMVLKNYGGSDADFRRMLDDVRATTSGRKTA